MISVISVVSVDKSGRCDQSGKQLTRCGQWNVFFFTVLLLPLTKDNFIVDSDFEEQIC